MIRSCSTVHIVTALLISCTAQAAPKPLDVTLRSRQADDEGWVQIISQNESWKTHETAVIVCDMWDSHHCLNAVRRVKQLAPRINALLNTMRDKNATIIHAPSACMTFYDDHPARKRAQLIPKTNTPPDQIHAWCHWINDTEQAIGTPIDPAEDDDLEEHQRWHEQLQAVGRNPSAPWTRQIDTIAIHDSDYITDDGLENWSILKHHNIKNILLVGVHTNLCVLGRPFGLRQMARHGKHVVLVRDLTDSMYGPAVRPFVNHYSGTDLVVEHIEQHVCPTISSDQILGGKPLRFRGDRRLHVAMLIGEKEHKTRITLPLFARQHLYREFRISYSFADAKDRNKFHGIHSVQDADLLLLSVRRRFLPREQLQMIHDFVDSGRPVIGIRTASHAFAQREDLNPVPGQITWNEFDPQVFGGNYHGHHGNKPPAAPPTHVWLVERAAGHPILAGSTRGPSSNGRRPRETITTSWLYRTSPLEAGTEILLMGRVGKRTPHEPVAWTFIHRGGGRSFYTSLGHPDDFNTPMFQRLLTNAVYWALDLPIPETAKLSQTDQH